VVSRRSFDDRVRDLVRADDASHGRQSGSRASDFAAPRMAAPRMDLVARALAIPMPRRRAIGLISGALVAGAAWRPGRARGAVVCSGNTPLRCEAPGGAAVCTSADSVCCSNDLCAGACSGWQSCVNGSCTDSAKMCGYPKGPFPNGDRPKFCSIPGHDNTYCTGYKDVAVDVGWCCRGGEVCGRQFGDCTCTGTVCGQHLCCQNGEICETNFLGSVTACVYKCPDGKDPCKGKGDCCTGDYVCTINGCACPEGLVAAGPGVCVPSRKDAGSPSPLQFIRNWLNMGAASSASHGGSSPRAVLARPATSGSLAVDAALIAIATVNGQSGAAQAAFSDGKRDPAFRHKVGVARVKPPSVVAGPGLDAASAAALNKLLAAEAKAYALVAASAKALWRSRAAQAKGQLVLAKSQLRASSKFAAQAAAALKTVPALRTTAAHALIAGGVAEVTPTYDQVTAFLATVKSSGIPAYLRTPLGALGVGSDDLKRVRAGLLRQTASSMVGPALIAPLRDAGGAGDLKQLTSELSKFATRARKHTIAR
jgi:hypothetical protein